MKEFICFYNTVSHHFEHGQGRNKSFYISYTVCAKLLQQKNTITHVTDGKI